MTLTEAWFQRVKTERSQVLCDLVAGLISDQIGGVSASNRLSDATDAWLKDLFEDELSSVTCTIFAVGGYGRQELCPQSDLDLLILFRRSPNDRARAALEAMLYQLWDAGFKVGHAIRSIAETIKLAQEDLDTKTAVLQARFLWGDPELAEDFQRRSWRMLFQGKAAPFAEAKLAERDARRARPENSRTALEPNIKEGSGALRDIHALEWIAHVVFETDDWNVLVARGVLAEAQLTDLQAIKDEQMKIRFHLHTLVGRPEERLTFDYQAEIAPLMGYKAQDPNAGRHEAIEAFMRQYYLNAWSVKIKTEIALAALKEDHARGGWSALLGFILADGRIGEWRVRQQQLMFGSVSDLTTDPLSVLRLFLASIEMGLQVHPKTLQMITTEQSKMPADLATNEQTGRLANKLLLKIITHPENPVATLRLMSDTGILRVVLPEWAAISGLMQFNRYHHYTVDAHILRALEWMHVLLYGQPERVVGQLDADQAWAVHRLGEVEGLREIKNLEGREHAAKIAKQFANHRVLLVAILLHDMMKGREGDHSVIGARLARDVCPRLGLLSEETEFVSWLILEHLSMSDIAFKRDLEDAQTIEQFADRVHDIEHLQALYILTVCDISAVGPDTWTTWKAALLSQLYRATQSRLLTGKKLPSARARARARRIELQSALKNKSQENWDDISINRVLRKLSDDYLAHVPLALQTDHAVLIREPEAVREVRFSVLQDSVDRWTELSVYCVDHHGLFAGITGAISMQGYSIESVRAYTLRNGMALDVFAIRTADGAAILDDSALMRLKDKIAKVIQGDTSMRAALDAANRPRAKRLTVLDRPPAVRFDNDASERYTVLEVEGANTHGELYRLASTLSRLNLQIHGAKISSYGNRYADVFYLADLTGGKIERQDRLESMREAVLAILTPKVQREDRS